MRNIIDNDWIVKVYGAPCAITKIDMLRPRSGLRWTYEVIILIYPSPKGVDDKGSRASGFATAAVISARPQPKIEYPLIKSGETIITPFGNYRVEMVENNDDCLRLIPIE